MKRLLIIAFSILTVLSHNIALAQKPQKQNKIFKTKNGFQFELTSEKRLIDKTSGIIWDLGINFRSKLSASMTHKEEYELAKETCESKGMELPSGYKKEDNGKKDQEGNSYPEKNSDFVILAEHEFGEIAQKYDLKGSWSSSLLPEKEEHWWKGAYGYSAKSSEIGPLYFVQGGEGYASPDVWCIDRTNEK